MRYKKKTEPHMLMQRASVIGYLKARLGVADLNFGSFFPSRPMGNNLYDPDRRYVTEFTYDLRERSDKLTDEEFEKVRKAVLEWGAKSDVPVGVTRSKNGFAVKITHPLENGDGFGMSLFLHLSAGIFRELEEQGNQE